MGWGTEESALAVSDISPCNMPRPLVSRRSPSRTRPTKINSFANLAPDEIVRDGKGLASIALPWAFYLRLTHS